MCAHTLVLRLYSLHTHYAHTHTTHARIHTRTRRIHAHFAHTHTTHARTHSHKHTCTHKIRTHTNTHTHTHNTHTHYANTHTTHTHTHTQPLSDGQDSRFLGADSTVNNGEEQSAPPDPQLVVWPTPSRPAQPDEPPKKGESSAVKGHRNPPKNKLLLVLVALCYYNHYCICICIQGI